MRKVIRLTYHGAAIAPEAIMSATAARALTETMVILGKEGIDEV